ncbi:hypothetical protein ACBQ24_09510 [Acinetobacter terrestris]|uniref:hypothetical protein n=1 Tax=Acinetobacter terrestris TaxID=2529843 RepID=UPI003525B9D9
MMTLTQAETAIHQELVRIAKLEDLTIEMPNKPPINGKPFGPPKNKAWSKVFIKYADSQIVGIGDKPCIRDQGIISIQCFAPVGSGLIMLSELCDTWRKYLQSFGASHLEVYKVHAPQSMDEKNFYAKIVRAEFRIN